MFTERMMEFLFDSSFFTLTNNSTDAEIHMPGHIVIGQSNNTLFTIVDHEVASQISFADQQPFLSTVDSFSISWKHFNLTKKCKLVQSIVTRRIIQKSAKKI